MLQMVQELKIKREEKQKLGNELEEQTDAVSGILCQAVKTMLLS